MKDLLYPLRALHGRLHDWRVNRIIWNKKRKSKPEAVFLVMSPTHGNLGDHAIAEAEKRLLEESNIPYYEVTEKEVEQLKNDRMVNVFNGKTILIHGGGNLGTLWFNVEVLTREIIKRNPRSKILMLPNTFYYEKSDWGEQEKQNSSKIYNNHRKLKIYAREKTSHRLERGFLSRINL